MIEIKAPDRSSFEKLPKIFLAGSIEMGKAEPWQEKLVATFGSSRVIFYNPRRTDWDASWVQDPTPGTPFFEQVTWELEHIDKASLVIFYFDPATASPITLMELGICLGLNKRVLICCPDGYFRKGNVVLTANRFGAVVLNSFDELVEEMKKTLK